MKTFFFREHPDFGTKIGIFSRLRPANSNNFEKWPTRVQKLDHPELSYYKMRQAKSEIIPLRSFTVYFTKKLCAKYLKMENVMSVVTKTVNFIRSKGLRHRQFQDLLRSLEADFEDVPYYCEIRWLSRGKVLERIFKLKDEIQQFMEGKGNPIAEFNDAEWICDLAFLADITSHLNELNSRLQRKGQLINCMFDHVKAFQVKLSLWENQINNKTLLIFLLC